MFQATVPSPSVFPLMRVDNRPLLYRHCYPDHRRSPASPILQTLKFITYPIPQVPGYWQSQCTAIFLAVDMFQASYRLSSLLFSDRIRRLVQRLLLKHSVDDASGKYCASQWYAPSHTVSRPVINYNCRLIRHECVYILQRNYLGYQIYVTGNGAVIRANTFLYLANRSTIQIQAGRQGPWASCALLCYYWVGMMGGGGVGGGSGKGIIAIHYSRCNSIWNRLGRKYCIN